MKKIFLLATIALLAVTINADAQRENRGPSNNDRQTLNPEKRADAMAKQLDLSEDQRDELVKHFEKSAKAWEKNREEASSEAKANREERRAEMEKVREQNDKDLEKIIGKDKMEKWRQIQKDRLEKRRENRSNRQGPPPPPPAVR